jgi:ABC-type transport system substrate-binding protein
MPGYGAAPGWIDPEDVAGAGRSVLPVGASAVDRINFRASGETFPSTSLRADDGGIIKESFDAVIQGDRLSPEMNARGMRLDKTVEPSIRYIGFNMEDPVLGAAAGDPGRKLRQAMSLAIDVQPYLELFLNGRGVPAQTVLPPGLFGYDERYKNPFRQYDLVRAHKLLAEAGYKDGIDTKTGRRLRLSFDTSATTAAANLQFEY